MINLGENKYLKNIAIILTGGLLAQLIGLMSLPVLSRLYVPEQFGLYSSFVALISLLIIIATLRLDFAIQIAKGIKEIEVLKAIIFKSLLILILALLFLWTSYSVYANLFKIYIDEISLIVINPIFYIVSFFSAVVVSVGMSINIWYKRFHEISKIRVYQASLLAIFSILFSFYNGFGLIYAYMASTFFIAIFFIVKRDVVVFQLQKRRVRVILGKYSKFPKYAVPSDIFNSFSNVSMPLIIAAVFTPTVAGLYFMTDKIIKAPLGVLYQSVSSVYTERAGKLYNSYKIKELIAVTNYTQVKIAMILAPILIFASILSPYFFTIILGDEWRISGELVKYFSILVFFNGLYSPVSQIGNILGLQKYLLYFNFSLAFFMVLSLIVFSGLGFSHALLISSLVGSLHFIFLNIYIQVKLRRLLNEKNN
ncbi:lipopolysaccharide biosynthesis protein [Kangiella sp.]|uniref:lipopolysaccharide biosynthesis protein n=1 Tax=Gammaproteobacteria TaxID=1236 RepID=UPI003A8F5165